ncbi:uncharacterized protein BDR25DRAFT_359760 [Lindgomyces ingoldianus]|uniref:Uncharacterized protein n=1 Tax=Lindgomyces ingoldianus TaxID=673940 RepID=A0ACB6QHR2_9PLEO|nr:uncharacterized protein BDR25DRAFT_359760 [Lindgomyces ingoldianus]KAF2466421.1 hypothetical protein BDR25DRAFT_359760 [Lindgomyces ingoldianus]
MALPDVQLANEKFNEPGHRIQIAVYSRSLVGAPGDFRNHILGLRKSQVDFASRSTPMTPIRMEIFALPARSRYLAKHDGMHGLWIVSKDFRINNGTTPVRIEEFHKWKARRRRGKYLETGTVLVSPPSGSSSESLMRSARDFYVIDKGLYVNSTPKAEECPHLVNGSMDRRSSTKEHFFTTAGHVNGTEKVWRCLGIWLVGLNLHVRPFLFPDRLEKDNGPKTLSAHDINKLGHKTAHRTSNLGRRAFFPIIGLIKTGPPSIKQANPKRTLKPALSSRIFLYEKAIPHHVHETDNERWKS